MWQCYIISELRTVWQISNPIPKKLEARDFSRVSVHSYVSQFKNGEKPDTASSNTYRVNGKEVDKDTFESALADIEEMYLDNIRDMLLNYCNFMDEVNDWRSRMFRW